MIQMRWEIQVMDTFRLFGDTIDSFLMKDVDSGAEMYLHSLLSDFVSLNESDDREIKQLYGLLKQGTTRVEGASARCWRM